MPVTFYRYKTSAQVAKYVGDEKHVVIPETYDGVPVTEIREDVFAGSDVISVVIPTSIQYIGDRAFEGCKKLMQITCDANAPEGCSVLPKGLLSIGEGAFAKTALLKVKLLTDVVIKIGAHAFRECSRLNTFEIPNCHSFMIGKGCFTRSSIERFSAPKSYGVAFPSETFSQCHELLDVDAGVVSVGNRCFYQCTWLEHFKFPLNKFKMGKDSFEGCTSLEIPSRFDHLTIVDSDSCEFPKDSIFNLPKAETSVPPKDGEAVSLEEASLAGKPTLFDLTSQNGECMATTLKGRFYSYAEGYAFNEEVSSTYLYCVRKDNVEKLRPLFDYLVKEKIDLVLKGVLEEASLHVCTLYPASLSAPFPKRFLEEVARKLLCERVPETNVEVNHRFHLGNYNQMMAFYDLVNTALPVWVKEAVKKNADIYNSSKLASDEQKHAETAMRYLLSIDWTPRELNVPSDEKEVRSILDKYFYGLEVVKERILEVLIKIRKTKTLPKYGILLNGPPGVGKTSIANALGDILGLPLFQFDMSIFGRDPDELSGSSRIYTNARPGRLADYMYDNRTAAGVLLINELDKSDRYGLSAANVFLPILDKVSSFEENFLQISLPTENLFSVATCNGTEKISGPMLDRFLVIDLPAYSKTEKRVILTDYVLPKVLRANGIESEQLTLSEEAIDVIIDEYALESGARDIEKLSERIASHCNKSLAANPDLQSKCYTARDIVDLLGPSKKIERKLVGHPGIVTSAFHHENSAYTYLIEASIIPGSGKFEVLGGIPAQQREYCKAAYYCVRNRAAFDLSKFDVTVFSPQPIPDSTSNQVGFACFAAICSRLTNDCLLTDKAVFLGGIDLYGNLFVEYNDLTPLLKTMKASKMTTLYAPMGTAAKINLKELDDCNISIIEAPDAPTLLTVATGRLKSAG